MSDLEAEEYDNYNDELGFVNLIKDYPAMFSKSQTPEIRKHKNVNVTEIVLFSLNVIKIYCNYLD